MTNLRTTYWLFIAVCLTGCFIWLFERSPESTVESFAPDRYLLNFVPERVEYLSFQQEGRVVECRKENGEWLITLPFAARADTRRLNRIVSIMEMLPALEVIASSDRENRGLSLGDYGLFKPRARVIFGNAESRHSLHVGAESPLKDAVYVQVDSRDEVISTSTNLLEILPADVSDVRDPYVLKGDPAAVQRMEIRAAGGALLEVVRSGAEWTIQKPFPAWADGRRLSLLLDQLHALRVRQFISETMADPVAYGLSEDEAAPQIGLWTGDEQTGRKILFGKAVDGHPEWVYCRCKGFNSIMAVSRESVEAFSVPAAELREARLPVMPVSKISRVRLEQGERLLQLEKATGGTWRMTEPKPGPADNDLVNDCLARLTAARVEAFLDPVSTNPADYGFDKPLESIVLAEALPAAGASPASSETVQTLRLGKSPEASPAIYARLDGQPQVFRLSPALASLFPLDPIHYRARSILALAPESIRRLALWKGGLEWRAERGGDARWTQWKPAEGPMNPEVLRRLFAELAQVRVKRFETEDVQSADAYGLTMDSTRLTVGLSGKDGIQRTLIFGEDTDDGVYAMIQGQDAIFVLENETAEQLTREWIP
ncbi:MAG: DUF4340 domain-containing protein [Lentisphaerae bacterium]|nr:DUF4340 domain-containing protein [Lentisphaerota bacterium]